MTLNNNIIPAELAPCGIFCGACPAFDKTCNGCASSDKKQKRISKWNCKIRVCCYDKYKNDFCCQCSEFPCKIIKNKLLNHHPEDEKFSYRHEIYDNFILLKELGLIKFVDHKYNTIKCPECDGIIYFYYNKCSKCGIQTK